MYARKIGAKAKLFKRSSEVGTNFDRRSSGRCLSRVRQHYAIRATKVASSSPPLCWSVACCLTASNEAHHGFDLRHSCRLQASVVAAATYRFDISTVASTRRFLLPAPPFQEALKTVLACRYCMNLFSTLIHRPTTQCPRFLSLHALKQNSTR